MPATGSPLGGLADLLAKYGDLDELRACADAGDEYAARRDGYAAPDGSPTSWPSMATSTDCAPASASAMHAPAPRLSALLAEQGRNEEAKRLRRFGPNLDGTIASF
jgi:hypothetical protein